MTNVLEQTLQEINRKEIQLNDEEVKRNNRLLDKVMKTFEQEFKKDTFFASLYERLFFGGSFYDGLKVGAPNEFDIDLIFKLPVNAQPTICSDSKHPAFVQVRMPELQQLVKNDYPPSYRDMLELVDGEYLSIPKIMKWFQRKVDIAKNALAQRGDLGFTFGKTKVTLGPAITFKIKHKDVEFDVDFVPCFKFLLGEWPSERDGYRPRPIYPPEDQLSQEFLVVPKPKDPQTPTYFRLSFQGQERRLLEHRGHLKPAIRLLKLHRNKYNDGQIKSYYFKSLALGALLDPDFKYTNEKLSSIFLQLFQRYIDSLKDRKLAYYWNENYNFYGACTSAFLQDACNRAERQLKEFNSGDANKIMKVFGVSNSTQSRYADDVANGLSNMRL